MKRLLIALALAAAPLAMASGSAIAQTAPAAEGPQEIIDYSAADKRMNTAIADARRTLPEFWRMHAQVTDGRDATLKVAFPTPQGGNEHMWFDSIKREKGVITGVLIVRPRDVDYQFGQTLTLDPAKITDWGIVKGGRMWGNYTTRVAVEQMPAAQAAEFRKALSDTPTEPKD